MSKKFSELLSQEERADLAKLVKPLREASGLSKKDVYDEARISRQTLDNIESGATVPQVDVLKRVLDVVGYEIAAPQFEQQTEQWLTMIGTLIEVIPAERRQRAVDQAIRRLVMEGRVAIDEEPPLIEIDAAHAYGLAAEDRERRADTPAADEAPERPAGE